MTKTISLLGSTGSIGRQTLDVAEQPLLSTSERTEIPARPFATLDSARG